MAIRQFDELKRIQKELDELAISLEIIKYFDEMDLPEEEIELRTKVASEFQHFFRNLFLIMATGEVIRESYIEDIRNEYIRICDKYGLTPNMSHIDRFAETIVDNTLQNINSDYYTSVERSITIAETETNNSANYDELQDMIAEGKTQKTWVTMQDNKVRETHMAIDGMTIGIDDLFEVGDALMRFPCDEEMAYDSPQEICGCRCSVSYQ